MRGDEWAPGTRIRKSILEDAEEHRPAGANLCGHPGAECCYAYGRRGSIRARRVSLVVLRFANIGGRGAELFRQWGTESLTTDLSRIKGALVIAHNTAFANKGKAFDVRETGHDLNVRYALGGSVQRGGDRMRVNLQPPDVEAGAHL